MGKQIFRKVSLERLSSPEQLDQLMRVTSPRGWLALIAVAGLLAAAVWWGIYGNLPTKIPVQGILLKSGGLQNVVTSVSGQITDIRIVTDDFVQKGDVIARIARPEILNELAEAKAEWNALQAEPAGAGREEKKRALERRIAGLQEAYERESRVVSPYSGRVVEVRASRGEWANPGAPIATLEISGEQIKDLVAIMYVPAQEGKKVMPGMEVQISPSTVRKEQFGFMIGKVTSVSDFPATRQGMMRLLGNEALVESLSGQGAVLEIRADLIPDASTDSGYRWSTRHGPPMEINSGTMFAGAVKISEERPIGLVIPAQP